MREAVPALAATVKLTVPGPEPDVPPVAVIHSTRGTSGPCAAASRRHRHCARPPGRAHRHRRGRERVGAAGLSGIVVAAGEDDEAGSR